MKDNDEVSGWPIVLAMPLRVASPLDWLVVWEMSLMEKTLPSVCKNSLPAQTINEIIITPDFDGATHQQKLDGLTTLFKGLSRAITAHGCQVDLSDTLNIRIFK